MKAKGGGEFQVWFSMRFLVAAALFCHQALAGLPAAPVAPVSLEYEVKAAFLLNFTKFIEWPPSAFAGPEAPLVICIAGDDPFGHALDQIVEGEAVNGHRIAVERVRTDQQKTCHVLYSANNRSASTPLMAGGPGVLTVGEGDEFIRQGGIIGFVIENRHVRFAVNVKAAANAGLKVSSKLLSVAKSVEK
jgi:hypothetical protein